MKFFAAFGVGVERHFGAAGCGYGIYHAATDVHIAVGIHGVVFGGVGTHKTAGYGKVGRGVDGVVGRGVAIHHAAAYCNGAFTFDTLVRAAAHADVAARKDDALVEFYAFGGNAVAALLSRTRETAATARRAEISARNVHRYRAAGESGYAVAADALAAGAAAVEAQCAAHNDKFLLAFEAGGFQRVAANHFGLRGHIYSNVALVDAQVVVGGNAAFAYGGDC